MFLSIIIPVYNTEKYLRECLDSCLNQGFSADEYEVICIDDGSKDGSLSVIKEYERSCKNVRVFTQTNSGVSAARNVGISAAKGEWIWFVDSDDYAAENSVADLYLLAQIKTDADAIEFCVKVFEDGNPEKSEVKRLGSHIFSKIYKTEFINNRGIHFIEELAYSEDEMFNFSCRSAGAKIATSGKCLYYYRLGRAESAMAVNDRKKRLDSFRTICGMLLKSSNGALRGAELNLYFYYANAIIDRLLAEKMPLFTLISLKKDKLFKVKHKGKINARILLYYNARGDDMLVFSKSKFFCKRTRRIINALKSRLSRS